MRRQKHTFEVAPERVRRSFRLYVSDDVVMREHVHLLISEPRSGMLADALKSLKPGVSRRLIRGHALLAKVLPSPARLRVGQFAPLCDRLRTTS